MTTQPDRAARTAALRAARTKDSQLKRRRALNAVQALESADAPVTAAAVASAAGVSTWLVYADGDQRGEPLPESPPVDSTPLRQGHHQHQHQHLHQHHQHYLIYPFVISWQT